MKIKTSKKITDLVEAEYEESLDWDKVADVFIPLETQTCRIPWQDIIDLGANQENNLICGGNDDIFQADTIHGTFLFLGNRSEIIKKIKKAILDHYCADSSDK